MKFNFIRYKPNLDELIFEGRNKAYGAYVLRKAYERRITFALITVCIAAIFSLIAYQIYLENNPESSDRVIDLSQYDGFDLNMSKNILPELPKGSEAKAKEKPKKTEKPKKQPDKPKDTPKDVVKKSDKPDFTKLTNQEQDTVKLDTLAKNGMSKADSIAAAIAEGKRLDSLNGLNGKSNTSIMKPVNNQGGLEEFIAWIQQNFVYPKTNILQYDCTIYIYLCINEDGTLSGVSIVKPVPNNYYNEELMRVAKMSPVWVEPKAGFKQPCTKKSLPVKIYAKPKVKQ